MPGSDTVICMNVSAKPHSFDLQVAGKLRVRVINSQIVAVYPCSKDCLLFAYLDTTIEPIALGGTRKESPGLRIGSRLLVTNVFTHSRRNGWPVHRSFPIFEEVIARLRANPINELVTVHRLCLCMTEMEFLDGYTLLDNRSVYTPPQHAQDCWLDHHSSDEFQAVYPVILDVVNKLHHLGIIHTDVTGFNILVDSQGKFKLIDLFSCVTIESLGPPWLPRSLKHFIGALIEQRQINHYLLEPIRKRWPTMDL